MIIITLTPSERQVISGIPQTVTVETNEPATVYYTVDGTLPTPLSDVYISPIYLPTTAGSVTLSVIAYYSDGYSVVPSSVLTEIYSTDTTDLNRTRYVFFEGIVYSYPGGTNTPLYYDHAGDAVFYIDIPLEDLALIEPTRDRDGNEIGSDNQITVLSGEYTGAIDDDEEPLYSSANDPGSFRPDARVITIDGRASAEIPVQVDIINGPLMSLRNSRKHWGGIDYINLGKSNVFSGSATKYHVNRQKNIIVFYYFDSNTGKWIKSIQDLPPLPTDLQYPAMGPPHVYKWSPYGRHQS